MLTFGGAASLQSAVLAQPGVPEGGEETGYDVRWGAWAWLILLLAVVIVVAAFAWLGKRHLGRR